MNIIVGRQNTEYGDCVELDLSLWFKKREVQMSNI